MPRPSLGCSQAGAEDWPAVHRRLIKLLDGAARGDALAPELARTTARGILGVGGDDLESGDCLPGQVALRLLLVLSGGGLPAHEAARFLDPDWRLLGLLGWRAVIRSGWPIFRLLRLLARRLLSAGDVGDNVGVRSCHSEEPFASWLRRHVRERRALEPGQSLMAMSVAYLAAAPPAGDGLCPLSLAAAFLVGVWARFPVYDSETEDAVLLAERALSGLALADLLTTDHGFLDIIDDIAGSYQAFLIDSGWLYKDLRSPDGKAAGVDYTRHMDSGSKSVPVVLHPSACPPPMDITPLGRCNPFAPLGTGLTPWRHSEGGIAPSDAARAFLEAVAVSEEEVALLRFMDQEVLAVTLPSVDPSVVECLAKTLLSVLSRASLPPVEFVVNFADRPVLRKDASESSHSGASADAPPPPLFSVCTSPGFWDIPFPGLCPAVRGECRALKRRVGRRERAGGRRRQTSEAGRAPHQGTMQHPQVASPPLAAVLGEFAMAECYSWRMFTAFAELLNYEPGGPEEEAQGGPFFGALPAGTSVALHRWRVPEAPPAQVASAFAARCARLIDAAAQ